MRGHLVLSFSTWTEMAHEFAGTLSPLWRVGDVDGRSLCDSLSPCRVAAHSHSLLQLNIIPPSVSDSAPLAIIVRCRSFLFSIVSISSCGKRLLELRVPMS